MPARAAPCPRWAKSVGRAGWLVGQGKPKIKKRSQPSLICLKLIIHTRKKDIYQGGEIGYDEANRTGSELRFKNKAAEGLKVRVAGRS